MFNVSTPPAQLLSLSTPRPVFIRQPFNKPRPAGSDEDFNLEEFNQNRLDGISEADWKRMVKEERKRIRDAKEELEDWEVDKVAYDERQSKREVEVRESQEAWDLADARRKIKLEEWRAIGAERMRLEKIEQRLKEANRSGPRNRGEENNDSADKEGSEKLRLMPTTEQTHLKEVHNALQRGRDEGKDQTTQPIGNYIDGGKGGKDILKEAPKYCARCTDRGLCCLIPEKLKSRQGQACMECRKSKSKCSLTSYRRLASMVNDSGRIDELLEDILEETRSARIAAEQANELIEKLISCLSSPSKCKLVLDRVEIPDQEPKKKKRTNDTETEDSMCPKKQRWVK